MKQLFHLKSRNLNETNLTSSKAKTQNEPISVKEISQISNERMKIDVDLLLGFWQRRDSSLWGILFGQSRIFCCLFRHWYVQGHVLESAHKQETQDNRNKIMIRYAHSISKALEQKRLNCTRRVLGGLNYQSHDVRQSVFSPRSRKLI